MKKIVFYSVGSHFKTKVVSEKHEGLFHIGCGKAPHALYRVHKEIIFTLNTDLLGNKEKNTSHNIHAISG